MTDFKTGDKGQRYEVRYTDNEGTEKVCGWSETRKGADDLVKSIELHPAFHTPKVIDRQAKKEEQRE